jgi:peptide/nickel transport system permease protein
LTGLVIVTTVLIIALFSAIVPRTILDPFSQDLSRALMPPTSSHYFGTDAFGRDEFARILYAARFSLEIGILPIAFATIVGTFVGMVSAYAGGPIDDGIMRITDLLMSLPYFLLAILIVASFGPGLTNAMLSLGISFIADFIRMARATTLTVKEEDYIRAERAVGAGHLRILMTHVLPNIISPLLVLMTLDISACILGGAALSFIGLGAQPPTPEWGLMLADTRTYLLSDPLLTLYPGAAIMVTSLGFNLLGDGLRDLLDPRYRGLT